MDNKQQQTCKPRMNQRQVLQVQIQTYKQKLNQYQQLQKEINQINHHINDTVNSKPHQSQRLVAQKLASDPKIRYTPAKRSTNKKIKIYQLQKKLQKVVHQYGSKQAVETKQQQNHSKLLADVDLQTHRIEEERQTAQKLAKIQKQIEQQIQSTSQKVEKQATLLQQNIKNKELFSFERRKLRDQIRNVRQSINGLINGCQQQDLQLSISQVLSDSEQQSLRASCHSSQSSLQDIHPSHKENDVQMWIKQQNGKIEKHVNRVQLCQERTQEANKLCYQHTKQITSNQIIVKHHKLTIHLLTSQLNTYRSFSLSAQQCSIRNIQLSKNISLQLSKLQGQRGLLRGQVGVQIQKQRLIRGVNLLLQLDLQKVKQKIGYFGLIRKMIKGRLDFTQVKAK